jgi:hypothetical protein
MNARESICAFWQIVEELRQAAKSYDKVMAVDLRDIRRKDQEASLSCAFCWERSKKT